ncbi:phosphatase PAP2 family protein [Methylobacterium haplocladii]|uniref:Phosphatidic acid phosphatase type 2/haloperoxidase domain-containing protein n=1 Tax=Methylobacterium haplocladii TaxID=1176176 RepID=A0A512IMN5_9HYPH|nr:phosphatase PAP2 family protein [Methylobacterium haplocladii]GEO98973.1 hypothetical protein MHA02_13610 [Methylobacterium haplocladii]GJD84180.1 hypothetical protein HPGCJGGD_2055 [Methylobacterium haplocladii]GLS60314.1 hypothetical protein GCM10007887_29930 [Methylobacterium haplocladii]
MGHRTAIGLALLTALVPLQARAQSAANVAALKGLAPVSILLNTPEGQAALRANLSVTGGIQTGALTQPLLLPFAEQQQLALRDAFITDGNATELADGLGSTLGGAYQAKARYETFKDFSSVSKSVADLIGYTNNVTKSDSNAGKYFFANATTHGKEPVSLAASAILTANGGTTDVFGKAYGRLAGSVGADAFGNSRPFQTDPILLAYRGADYFGMPSHSLDWLRGPSQNLTDSPSYPSGHTTYGYTESVLLAILVPERYQQMITRAAEYGNNRIVIGAHYAMDVLGGRTVALHAVAHLLANHPDYVGQARKNPAVINAMGQTEGEGVVIADYPAALKVARADLTAFLTASCGGPVAACAATDLGRFKDAFANRAFYETTQTYGLPVVYPATAGRAVDVGQTAPEAGYLLTAAFPSLTLDEANAILTATLGPGGGFLDDGSAFGLYSRLDLYAAAGKAAALAAGKPAAP